MLTYFLQNLPAQHHQCVPQESTGYNHSTCRKLSKEAGKILWEDWPSSRIERTHRALKGFAEVPTYTFFATQHSVEPKRVAILDMVSTLQDKHVYKG